MHIFSLCVATSMAQFVRYFFFKLNQLLGGKKNMRCTKCKTTLLCNKCAQSCDKCKKIWCAKHWTGRQHSYSIWLCGRCKKTSSVVFGAIHSSHKTCLFEFLQRKRNQSAKCIDCMPELFANFKKEAQGVVMLEFIKRTKFPHTTRICREEDMQNMISSPQQYNIFKSPWEMYMQCNKKTHVVLCSIMYVEEWDQTLTSFGLYKA